MGAPRPYNNLLMTPVNVKQYIDWLLRVGMRDIALKDDNMGDNTYALAGLLRTRFGTPVNTANHKDISEYITELIGHLCCIVGYCHTEDEKTALHIPGHKGCDKTPCGTVDGSGLAAKDHYDRKENGLSCCRKGRDCDACNKLKELLKKVCVDNYGCMLYTLRSCQTLLTGVTFNNGHTCGTNHGDNKCNDLRHPKKYFPQLKTQLRELIMVLDRCQDSECNKDWDLNANLPKWKNYAEELMETLEKLIKLLNKTQLARKLKQLAITGTVNTADPPEISTLRTFCTRLGNFLTVIGRRYCSTYGVQATWPECSFDTPCNGCKKNKSCPCQAPNGVSCNGKCCDDCDLKKCGDKFLIVLQKLHPVLLQLRDWCDDVKDMKCRNGVPAFANMYEYLRRRDFEVKLLGTGERADAANAMDRAIKSLENIKKELNLQDTVSTTLSSCKGN